MTIYAIPNVLSITPTSGPVGTNVQIHGTGLSSTTGVSFNGTAAASFTVLSNTFVAAIVAPGTTSGPVMVTTPGGTMSADDFTVVAAPTVASFTPSSGGVGTSVTITGTSLTGATAVRFDGTDASSYTVDSGTQITATVADGTTSGAITVITPGGTATLGERFHRTVAAPQITSFSPSGGATGAIVEIDGNHFTGATDVELGGTSASDFTVSTTIRLPATVGTGATGTRRRNHRRRHRDEHRHVHAYYPTPMVYSAFDPSSAAVGSSITITGSGLTASTEVDFGGVPARTFSVDSDTQITATVPAGATTGRIDVISPGGTASSD